MRAPIPATSPGLGRGIALPVVVFFAVLAAQLPLVLNPGYFSHDELQWAAWAAAGLGVSWSDFAAFQYRPLTFQSWLWLSRVLFARPEAFHLAIVAIGAFDAALLAALSRRLGAGGWAALLGALAFSLGPYAMYVHGWVGTLADLLWVGCALGIGLVVATVRAPAAAFAAGLLLTTLALLSKEAAVVVPLLLALAAWLGPRRRLFAFAAMASALAVVAYLALRLPVLWQVPADAPSYDWNLAQVPGRWLEYQLYPPLTNMFEIGNTLSASGKRIAVSALLWLALSTALWRAGPRWLLAFIVGGALALGPVLLLPASYDQYGYGFAALAAAVAAGAWSRTAPWGRGVIACVAVLALWHGHNVMRGMRHVGEVQAMFSPALARAVSAAPGDAVLRLRPDDPGEAWIYRRLTHEIPAYAGIPIGDRVRLVGAGEPADYAIARDGALSPLR